ncbi:MULTISPECIES: acetyl-CoA carboxylase biotin carboxyl carrier protein subunit [Bacillaceae]|jgi:acetyl-CoA carboxylase biotin carboxyl carrier protein|uniref:acetyl-CoA carboxylase biotin carboxyl carrier protein subunit n=1 Tax=Bacillaceae TaxID=186817 RepID=UPI0006AEFC79|nr:MULTISPECIES: acetyl-CoA carboxylase biotin carboxyl carrier protein subunit [Bacillaceae]ALC86156.1 acetyl-CoA carboxylase [Bacillus sp. FJAT-22090]KQL36562.1 biotin/lipoyl attachment protein [Psychrobacillus sp. FJAT-21963]MDF2068626.1 acetyl-CoA carboxylase biotin carboxyl carrier protein subunit [Bacillus sp. Cr_A10]
MKNLESTMAGTVFTVNVEVGEEVSAGQVVMVLESMKMEIPIEAEVAGKVASINAKEGDFVNEGDVLVTFE